MCSGGERPSTPLSRLLLPLSGHVCRRRTASSTVTCGRNAGAAASHSQLSRDRLPAARPQWPSVQQHPWKWRPPRLFHGLVYNKGPRLPSISSQVASEATSLRSAAPQRWRERISLPMGATKAKLPPQLNPSWRWSNSLCTRPQPRLPPPVATTSLRHEEPSPLPLPRTPHPRLIPTPSRPRPQLISSRPRLLSVWGQLNILAWVRD